MKILIFITTAFISLNASAEITISAIRNASNFENLNSSTDSNLEVYGGFAGELDGGCANVNNASTCNNCDALEWGGDAPGDTCNYTRAYPNLQLTFVFTSSTTFGTPRLLAVNTGTGGDDQIDNEVATTSPNSTVTLTTDWGKICSAMPDGDNTCTKSGNRQFKIGIDGSGDGEDDYLTFTIYVQKDINDEDTDNSATDECERNGLCAYSLFPGDSKVTIENVQIKETTTVPVRRLHFFCQEVPGAPAPGSVTSNDFELIGEIVRQPCGTVVVTNGTLEQNVIKDINNDVVYVFRGATEDRAGNIGFFTDPSTTTAAKNDDTTCPAAYDSTGLEPGECHVARPSEVAGLFSETDCFIATAAYGSVFDPHIDIFREFRGKVLLKTWLGKKFVRWYYTNSPEWAAWISQSPHRRFATRLVLTPAFIFAYGVLRWQWSLILLGLLIGIYFLRKNLKQQKGRS